MDPGLSRGPGVEVERAVPEVWCSSRSGSRSGEGVAVLRSLDDRLHSGRKLKPFFLRCSKENPDAKARVTVGLCPLVLRRDHLSVADLPGTGQCRL